MNRPLLLVCFFVLILLLAGILLVRSFSDPELADSVTQGLDDNLAEAFSTIRPIDPYNHCKLLSHPRFGGRYPGTAEFTAAAEWTAGRFREWGLKPGGPDGSYLQPYPSPYSIIQEASLTIDGTELEAGSDFLPLLFSDSGDVTAGLVFVGWGISAPELGYDDYAGVDVEGKLVLSFRGTPDPDEKGFIDHDHHRTRMLRAKEKGAAGLFYIYEKVNANPNGDRVEGFLPATITDKAADGLFEPHGISAADLRRQLRKTKKPRSFPLESTARLSVKADYHPNATAYNVLAWIEGSDPELRGEFIVIGAHLDHCGRHMDLLFAGADDNGSGSSCVLEIAEAFGRLERPPRRSVLLALFGSEERGLIGSQHLVDNLPSMVGTIDTMLNMDMVGEGEGTGCVCTPGNPEQKNAVEKADAFVGTVRRISEFRGPPGVRGSDHASFRKKGIPAMAFWSNGPHLHYHQTGDTIYRINPDMLADMSRLVFLTAFFLADRAAVPEE